MPSASAVDVFVTGNTAAFPLGVPYPAATELEKLMPVQSYVDVASSETLL